jgi:hypothetical protein
MEHRCGPRVLERDAKVIPVKGVLEALRRDAGDGGSLMHVRVTTAIPPAVVYAYTGTS